MKPADRIAKAVAAVDQRMDDDADLDSRTAAQAVANVLSRGDVNLLASEYLVSLIARRERRRVHGVERAAQTAAAPEVPNEPRKRFSEKWYDWARTYQDDAWIADRERREDELQSALAEVEARSYKRIEEAMRAFRDDLRLEWTQDLLAEQFALRDGTKVAWGEATVDQHQDRIDMFMSQAAAGIEGAARHQQALDDLTASGARSLNDLVRTPERVSA